MDALLIIENDIVLCFGFEDEITINQILKQNPLKILIVEPSINIYNAIKNNFELNKLFSHEKIFSLVLNSFDNEEKIYNFLKTHLDLTNVSTLKLSASDFYSQNFNTEYLLFLKIVKRFVNDVVIDKNTLDLLSIKWQNNIFTNIKHLFTNYYIDILKNIFTNKPIIIVASGPSLNKNINYLKEIQGKIPIFCLYTSYKVLVNAGIKPDLVIAIDASQCNLEKPEDKLMNFSESLAFLSVLDNNLLKQHTGKKILMTSHFDPFATKILVDLNKDVSLLNNGGSVVCIATSLAIFCGANKIIFMGLDLAFTGDKTHADGTYYSDNSQIKINNNIVTEDIFGNNIPTSNVLLSFKSWLEKYISNYTEINFIDATEGGAKIKGTSIMSLVEATKDINDYLDVNKTFDLAFSKGTLFNQWELRQLLSMLKTFRHSLLEVKTLNKQALEISQEIYELLDTNDSIKINQLSDSLDIIDKKILIYKNEFIIISIAFAKIQLDLGTYDYSSEPTADKKIMRKNIVLYEGFYNNIDLTIETFSTGINELQNFIDNSENR